MTGCRTDTLTFRLSDPDRHLAAVRLVHHTSMPREGLFFTYDEADRAWRLDVVRPRLWRLEYLLELRHHDGRTEHVCDPENPRRVGGAFGDKSVLQCPEYTEPEWLTMPEAPGEWYELTVPAPPIRADVKVRVWSPPDPGDRLLVAHDGPEYEHLAALGRYSAAMVAAGRVPPHRLVLLAPGDRNDWYSANPAYAWAFAGDVLPRLYAELGTTAPIVGMGASLGGLAMLHTQRRYPAAFAGLFLQSGSFFRPRFDRHESGFGRYYRLVRFTGRVVRAHDGPPVPTVLTCGLAEENLHNNREMAATLRGHGYPLEMVEVPDAHNYTCWRDAFDPGLTRLLRTVWG